MLASATQGGHNKGWSSLILKIVFNYAKQRVHLINFSMNMLSKR